MRDGRLWFVGQTEPRELTLAGNYWRDLAGRRPEFTNPRAKPGDLGDCPLVQKGTTGDITAPRKVKVPDIPMDQIGEYYAARKPFPWHWGNSLYLEWFSETNGRVVIKSTGYDLKIVGDPAWEMTPEEDAGGQVAGKHHARASRGRTAGRDDDCRGQTGRRRWISVPVSSSG